MENLLETIKNAFGALWKCRMRGNSLEVITPFATSTDMYVSIFITRQGNAWVITDGGWTTDGVYDIELPNKDFIFSRVLSTYIDDFEIKQTVSPKGSIYYYKVTQKQEMIPNMVFDVASFISQVINFAAANIKSNKDRITFKKKVKNFVSSNFDDNIKYDTYINNDYSNVRFNIIVGNNVKGLSLINLVSGDNSQYLNLGFARSNLRFQLIARTPIISQVKNRIVMIDDSQISLESSDVRPLVDLAKANGQIPMAWSSRFNLKNEIA